MKKAICLIIAVLTLILTVTIPSYAFTGGSDHGGGAFHGRGTFHGGGPWHSGGIWIGPGWGWGGWGPWWWGTPAYPYYYAAPPLLIREEPSVYVEPAPQTEEQSYWYYCRNPQGYYPYIKQCPGGWMKVVPYPVPPDVER